MGEYTSQILAWIAPIASTVIITIATAQINARIAEGERKRDEARAETEEKRLVEAQWREVINDRIAKQDEKIDVLISAQCTQMRSDLIHRAHRYVDDMGCAGTEEKDAFWAEYEDYVSICNAHGITNNFIDNLAMQVMSLPNRDGVGTGDAE